MMKWKHYYTHVQDRITFNRSFLSGTVTVVALWGYFTLKKVRRLITGKKHRASLAFYPQPVGAWYNIWLALQYTDIKIKSKPAGADYVFIFDDSTFSGNITPPRETEHAVLINQKAVDISKTHVSDIFETVFGYPVHVDPAQHKGKAVEKSDINGLHDGRIVNCPLSTPEIKAGFCYQKLIDSTFTGQTSEDLRIACVFGEVAAVFHKQKALDKRFGTEYLSTTVHDAKDVFSVDELSKIKIFCAEMGLDFGAVDVMRDKVDGNIYIVDVNKTGMPVLSLPWKEQLRSLKMIGSVFEQHLSKS